MLALPFAFALVCLGNDKIGQGERTKFDRFVDQNVRGAKRRVYSDLRIYRNEFFLRLKIHKIGTFVPRFDIEKRNFIVSIVNHETLAM